MGPQADGLASVRVAYLFLTGAICSEICATLSLRAADGFSKPIYIPVIVLGYGVAFALLSFALQHGMSIAIAYALWSAAGIAAVAVLSMPLFGDRLSVVQVGGIALIIVGVMVLELGTSH